MVKSDSDSSSESDSAAEAKKRMPEEDFLLYSETHSEKSCDISQLSDSISHLSESEGKVFYSKKYKDIQINLLSNARANFRDFINITYYNIYVCHTAICCL